MKKKLICFAGIMMILLCMLGAAAAETDSAGNVFITESDTAVQTVERDLYWAGSSREFSGFKIGKSFIAAGRDVTLSESEVGGSIRAAGYTVTLNGVDVSDNITAAGNKLQMSGITAAAVYAAGESVYFSGTAESVGLFGDTVVLEGEIRGNALLYGDNIILGENLKVEGTLTAASEIKPVIPSGADIHEFVYKDTKTTENAEDGAAKEGLYSGFPDFIRGMFGALLLGVLMCLLIGAGDLGKPGEMLLSRPVPMLVSGFAGLFAIPGLILLLLLIMIGIPSAGLLAILFVLVCIFSLTFAGVSLAKALMPKLTNIPILNNEWICSIIGAVVFWLIRKIPVIGLILQFASLIYALGYFIQVIFLRLRGSSQQRTKGTISEIRQNEALEPVTGTDPAASAAPSPDVLEKIPVYGTDPAASAAPSPDVLEEIPALKKPSAGSGPEA